MDRDLTPFKGAYSKDIKSENVLELMNKALSGKHHDLVNQEIENQITFHILGAPRSGTTLVNQYLISALNLGYPNNLIATFYEAPLFGIELSKKLLQGQLRSSFKSNFGRTSNINEPHEFGYFWNKHLCYKDLQGKGGEHEKEINWTELTNLINNMSFNWGQPFIFKSFLLGFHARKMFEINPKSIFIYIERDALQNANSILKYRESVFGDLEKWVSIKPLEFEELQRMSPYDQVAGQIKYLRSNYLSQLSAIPESNVIRVNYEQFCANPRMVVDEVCQKAKLLGRSLKVNETELGRMFNVTENQRDDESLTKESLLKFDL